MLKKVIQKKIIAAVKKAYDLELDMAVVEHPANSEFGDFATSVALTLAKELKQSPMEIAEKLHYEIQEMDNVVEVGGKKVKLFEKTDVAQPGFINFTLTPDWLLYVLESINGDKDTYGSSDFGGGKIVLIEYSNPNSNKPLHIGHARNNFLGSSLANLLEAVGYKVIKSNYPGDIGLHICKGMLMYLKHGEGKTPESEGVKSDHFVGQFYVLFEKESEKDPKLLEEAQEMLRKWEAGDTEVRKLWKKMNDWAYAGWKKTYDDQKIEFDVWEYESESINIGKEMAELAVEKNIAERQEDGSIIARLEKYDIPDKILLRSDGTSVYATKDLQLAYDGYNKYKYHKRLYVVDSRQSDYFRQVFKILELLGYEWAKGLHHISYGFVKLHSGNMSSRTGIVINSDDVFDKLIELEKKEIGSDVDKKTVEAVALAAYKYSLLKFDVSSDITFDYSMVTKFEGDTGPYIQYTHARANSVLEKAELGGQKNKKADFGGVFDSMSENELSVLRFLYRFPEEVERSASEFAPNLICSYLFELAQRFNSFYNDVPILNAETQNQKLFRLSLTSGVMQVLQNGLNLLGIEAPKKM